MISESADQTTLQLAGYAKLTDFGYALPCYGRNDRGNAWYAAVSSIPGDHRGTIASFDLLGLNEIVQIPPELIRTLRIGDPWCDVFLWNSEVFVGEAEELWNALSPIHTEICKKTPLTAVDLAIAAKSGEQVKLALSAFQFLGSRFSSDKAVEWRNNILLRGVLIGACRRLITALDKPGMSRISLTDFALASHGRQLSVVFSSNGFSPALSEILNRAVVEIEPFTEAFELQIGSTGETATDRTYASEVQDHNRSNARDLTKDLTDELSREDSAGILVVTIGKRSKEIARYMHSPDWLPAEQQAIDDGATVGDFRRHARLTRVISAGSKGSIRAELFRHRYNGLVVLLDDEYLRQKLPLRDERLLQAISTQSPAIRLLVPALPAHRPVRDLGTDALDKFFERWRFSAVVDTSVARSPFWWGNPKRSLDRRVADTVLGAALLAQTGKLSGFLRHTAPEPSSRLLTYMIASPQNPPRTHRGQEILFGSEESWSKRADGSQDFSTTVEISWSSASAEKLAGKAIVHVGPRHQNFAQFGLAVAREIAGSSKSRAHDIDRLDLEQVPRSLEATYEFPEYVCGIECQSHREVIKIALSAEAPTLKTLEVASEIGWQAIRYTDRNSLLAALAGQGASKQTVPDEVSLQGIRPLMQNRRLVTRGVDPRDVVRLTGEQYRSWLKSMNAKDREAVRGIAMRYLSKALKSEKRQAVEYVLNRELLSKLLGKRNRNVRELISILRIPKRESVDRPFRRLADLRACWSSAGRAYHRYAIVDGAIPPVVLPLSRSEAPAQTFFLLKGDRFAAVLFESRAFDIWARATLSRSTSWTSRFSARATFETFPIPEHFEMLRTEHGAIIRLQKSQVRSRRSFEEAVEYLERDKNSEGGKVGSSKQFSQGNRDRARQLVDEAILDMYDLPRRATGFQVLSRLADLNIARQGKE